MESSKFHQQHQDHQPVHDSSCYELSWSQNPILYNTIVGTNVRDLKQHEDTNIGFVPCQNTSNPMLGSPMINVSNNNVPSNPTENFMSHELQRRLARMKDEFSSPESYSKFSELINSSPTSSIEDLHVNPSPGYNNNQEMFLRTFSNGCQIKGGQLIDPFSNETLNNNYQNRSSRTSSRGTFAQIFPTINVPNLNRSTESISSNSFDMNLPAALDLFGSPAFDGNCSYSSTFNMPHQLGSFFKDTCLSYGLDQMHHQPNHTPLVCHSKLQSSSFNSRTGCTEAKRPATGYINPKAPQAMVQKKSKLEPRSTCAPFKVRKEKLGDRIAALQQLVAPFGKTDTASVLMEAIGYIKFLQNQVETLSVPYMKSSHKNNGLPTRGVLGDAGNKDTKRDLRSRGLCLIPLSCLSYVTDDNGGVWPTS
ncbi:hypothetical protein R6Q57_010090 [Mikania cordata]